MLSAFIAAALSLGVTPGAHAADGSVDIERVSGTADIVQQTTSDSKNIAIASTNDANWQTTTTVSIPNSPADGVAVSIPGADPVGLGLPADSSAPVKSRAGTVVYANDQNGYYTGVQPTMDGSARLLFNLARPGAPSSYQVPLRLSTGASLKLNDDGSVDILAPENTDAASGFLGHFDAPTAQAADGWDVQPRYEVAGTTLTLRLNLTQQKPCGPRCVGLPLPASSYPIVATVGYHTSPGAGSKGSAADVTEISDADSDAAADSFTDAELDSAQPLDGEDPTGGIGPESTQPQVATESVASNGVPWIGKLFIRTPIGTKYCTGTVVSGDVVMTAAHCLRWHGLSSSLGMAFVPKYTPGHRPYGTWGMKRYVLDDRWGRLHYNPNFDFGFIDIKPRNGKYLSQVTGTVGYLALSRFNYNTISVQTLGYPGGSKQYARWCNTTESPIYVRKNKGWFHRFFCSGYSDGVSGTGLIYKWADNGAGSTAYAVLGGYKEGGEGSTNYAADQTNMKWLYDHMTKMGWW
ncbi:trypsin-like serine protease [Actinoallomurus sp. NPDC052274]|uniref:trypsin-like serine peptidase n=1 Tax=Actinoallomurus sp. NPDC052274 TaxID=3155420 RepID=UPI0034323655